MTRQSSIHHRQSGFTLIELLVVIAIIAILAAILFPVFAQAKLAAKKTSDLAQIKQIGTAIHIYLNDSDDMMPLESSGIYGPDWNGHVRWSGNEVLQPYIKNGAIFKAPGESQTVAGILAAAGSYHPALANPSKVYVNSYMANAVPIGDPGYDDFAFDPAEKLPTKQPGLFGPGSSDYEPDYPGYPPRGTATNATQVQFPSELIMLADGATELDAFYKCTNDANTQILWCGEDVEHAWNPIYFATNLYGNNGPDKTMWRKYNGNANFAMADSSARNLKPGQLVTKNVYTNQHRWIVSPGQ